jgi:hypothetical protein
MTQITVTDLDNAKLDVDTIAGIANGTTETITDRLGNPRRTIFSLSNEYPNSEENAATATAQAVISTNSATASQAAQIASEAARDESVAARDAVVGYRNVFATTEKALSKGVSGVAAFSGGSGGTNGTFSLTFAGGGGTGAAGTFTVTSGYVASVNITASGDSYTSTPTLGFSASAGLTGVTAVCIIANNVDVGEYFSVPSAVISESFIFYKNNAGTAQELFRLPSSYNLKVQGMDKPTHFVIVDSIGNKLIDVTPTNILHPVIQSLVATQTAANATIAAVKPSMGAAELDIN